ncbi:hypothetical protein CGZ94_15125 [Enemella evansiae]|uniref:Uncharacterized protein n=1 Tax=Enemella evansiae TaxID=2016499 RepID=A0A255G727_9ACTN|nr:hypothetical protein [Enemella evansiae]OYO09081.1 hypothetical protein CGZ98_15015 [Enemella evansiae]OYO11740.1 hypothetical protein CGZ94_15125 [Enemella evansiae]
MSNPVEPSVARVLWLARAEWPDEVAGRQAWIGALGFESAVVFDSFDKNPGLADGLVHVHGTKVVSVGWFEKHPRDAALIAAHERFVARVSEELGAPVDRTVGTVCWRTDRVQVEAYAHRTTDRIRQAVHQLGVSRLPIADELERAARERSRREQRLRRDGR